ncbi:MAG: hypothetical protein CSYNP_00435 [Syntrophus sp. SKADARSKE-3]|nr:hypothetical protein [Syntrophus sp. SKADARSKE-3]
MLRRTISVLFAVLLFLSFIGEPSAATWSFDQIIKEACTTYPSVLSKESARSAAGEDLKTAKWQRFPNPSVETGCNKGGNNYLTGRVDQILWAGGRISSGIDAAKSTYDAADKAILEDKYSVAFKVIEAYVDALRQQGRRTISQTNVKQHELLDDTIKRRVDAEVSPEVDRRLSRARLAQASNELSTFLQALAKSLTQLSQLSGKDVTEVATIDFSSIKLPDNKTAAIKQAVSVSPTLSRIAFEESAAESQIKQRKSAFWPSISLRYEKSYYNYGDQSYPYNNYSNEQFLIVLQAQPGAGLSAYSGMQSAVARKKTVQEQRKASLRELTQAVSDAWDEMTAAKGRLEDSILAKSSSIDVFESYKKQFITGRKSWLDVMNAVREATQSEINVVDVEAQVEIAALRLALLTGNLNLGTP